MQITVLILIASLLLHDQLGPATLRLSSPALTWGLWLLPPVILGLVYLAASRFTIRLLRGPQGSKAIRRLDRVTTTLRLALLAQYELFLVLGGLTWLQDGVGVPVLLPEILFMLPTLGLIVASWACYYPIDRRMRQATVISRIDAGQPIYPIWTLPQFLLAQVRHQLALMGLPLLALLGWVQCVEYWVGPDTRFLHANAQFILLLAGTGCVYLLAPVVIRHVWDTVPLPQGPLNDHLREMCRLHHVGVREMLVWRTFGGTINAAVMGLVAPFRYILLTDALLDLMPQAQVEAVMAHELAHIRKRHMFWLLVSAAAALAALQLGINLLLAAAVRVPETRQMLQDLRRALADLFGAGPTSDIPLQVAIMVAALLAWLPVFGWISRRFERQADTFAVQHLTQRRAEAGGQEGMPLIDAPSVETMQGALQAVADLNYIPRQRKSWRHGSIAWRQDYLQTLIGQPAGGLAIDRQLAVVNLASLAILLGSFAIEQIKGW